MTDTDQERQTHLDSLLSDELKVARQRLTDAGRVIDELRADALSLAVRVDQARQETDRARADETAARSELAQAREQAAQEIADLQTTNAALEAHISRLKQQLERPFRLVAKKVLRRGAGTKPAAS